MTVYAGPVLDGLSDDGRYYYDVVMVIRRVSMSSFVVLMDRHEDCPPNRPPEKGGNLYLPRKFGLVPFSNCEWYGLLYRGIILKDTKRNSKRNSSLLYISAMNSYRVGLSLFGKIANILNNREN